MADSKALALARYQQIEDCEPVTEYDKDKVRLLVCANATDAADATELMMILGVHPGQPDSEFLVGPNSHVARSASTPLIRGGWE